MSKATRKAKRLRAQDVRKAHRQGFTYSGFKFKEAGGPESLAERNRAGLQKQAAREVKSSYAPLDDELSRRDQKVRALDGKRAADEAVYKDWLVQQQNTIRSNAETANAKLQGMMADQKKQLQERLKASGAFREAAGAAPGAGVVDSQGNAQVAQTQGEANVGAIQGLANAQLGATQSNSLAFTAQQTAKRQADTLEQLAEVADLRTKGALQQAADQQKRIAELLEGEVQKSQIRIASQQFSVKEINDANKDAADIADKNTKNKETSTEHLRQDADRDAARAQKDADFARKFQERHGISYTTWQNYSQSRKNRIIRQKKMGFGGGEKGSGSEDGLKPRQTAAARGNLRDKVRRLKTAFRDGKFPTPKGADDPPSPPISKKTGKPARLTPGNGQIWSEWLQTNYGEPAGLADMIVGHAIYGATWKPSKRRRDAFNDYAASLPT